MTEYLDRYPTMHEYAEGKRINPKLTDLISRADAIEHLKILKVSYPHADISLPIDLAIKAVEMLPSAELTLQTPQTYGKSINPSNAEVVEDLISRADAINAFWEDSDIRTAEVRATLKALPSADAVRLGEYRETYGVVTIEKQNANEVGEIKHIVVRSPNYTRYFYNESMPTSAEAVHKPDYSYEADMVRRLKEAPSAEPKCESCKHYEPKYDVCHAPELVKQVTSNLKSVEISTDKGDKSTMSQPNGKLESANVAPKIDHDREWIIGCIKHDGFIKTDRFDKANQIILKALSADAVKRVDCSNFLLWLLEEIMDEENWELNAVANGEIIARKLKKLGLLEVKDGYYHRIFDENVWVVRCKDCRWYEPKYKDKEYDCPQGLYAVCADDYCSHAERREE